MKFVFDCNPKYYKNEDLFKTATEVDYSDMKNKPTIERVSQNGAFTITIPDDQVRELQIALNYAIVGMGMDNQDTVNYTGRLLYWIYDEIVIQLRENKR
ncbi:MAG: hypothetical protein IKS19_00030 [Clostridia bacterium]|nr:hypothetical protein [Clostridia bacterium]